MTEIFTGCKSAKKKDAPTDSIQKYPNYPAFRAQGQGARLSLPRGDVVAGQRCYPVVWYSIGAVKAPKRTAYDIISWAAS